LLSSIVAEVSEACLLQNGKFTTTRYYVQYISKRWVVCGQPYQLKKLEPVDDEQNTTLDLALSVAFSSFYDWKIVLGFHEALPKISLVTDPIGSREIFKLRDIPAGMSRRAALKHWVREHYRKSVRDPDEETKIIAHLRGAEEFVWNGMYCRIQPSQHDLNKAAELRLRK